MAHLAVHEIHEVANFYPPNIYTVYNLWIGATKTSIQVWMFFSFFLFNVKFRSL